MSIILWLTSGDLGSSPEGTSFSVQLNTVNNLGGATAYSLISGRLPSGLALSTTGQLTGTPLDNGLYKFVIRASSTIPGDKSVTDQTFSLSVVGHAPVVSSTITLPDQFDITEYSYQVIATDVDIQDSLTYRIVSGALPNNLTMSRTGLISGIITQQLPQRFEFVVAVSDGTYVVNQRLILNIKNRAAGVAIKPLLLNRNSNIGTFKVEDQFSYKIDGSSDGITISKSLTYSISSGILPPGLVLRTDSGWIDGFLSKNNYPSAIKITYPFVVVANSGAVASDPRSFTITIDPLPVTISLLTWNVDRDLGTITLGSYSRLDISPHNDETTTFRIKTGALPPNLILQPDGLIAGRVSFLTSPPMAINQTKTYTFIVEMVNAVNNVVAEREFTVKTLYQAPYETLYLQTFPRMPQRDQIIDLLTDVSIVPPSLVFRPTDENFGVMYNFKMLVASGLTSSAAERYVAAMVKNHQRKVAYVQEFKLAVAKDPTTNLPVYEVVYAVLVDTDQIAPAVVKLRIPNRPKIKVNNTQINASYASLVNADQATVTRVFPASFNDMRQDMVNAIMAVSSGVLPEWMTTVQQDGTTVDYTNVLPLVYAKVGRGAEILSNIKTSKELFNKVPFDIDGYVWESYQQPAVIGANEIATSGITTKYLAFPRTGISRYSR